MKLSRLLSWLITALCLAAAPFVSAKTYIGLVQGLPGEAYYQRQFDEQLSTLSESSKNLPGSPEVQVFQGNDATKIKVLDWLEQLAGKATANDRLALYFVGHGSWDQRAYKFNVAGADLTDTDLQLALLKIEAELKLLINFGSASGALLKTFSEDENLVLITATKSGGERNATRFGRFFTEALAAETADVDKNKMISAKEAYDFAERATQEFYTDEGLLATEHSRLQGEQAGLLNLSSLQTDSARQSNPAERALYAQRQDIDLEIERLRLRRIGMSDDDYRDQFRSLMIQLSLLQAQMDELEGSD